MGYVGNEPTSNFASVTKDSFSGDGSTTAFTLSKAATTNGVAVFVENVRQEPTTAYAVSGTTLTFTAAPVSASGNNIYVLHHNAPASTAIHSSAQALSATAGTFSGNVNVDGGSFTFNDSGADLDFRVESDGDANMLFVDGGNNRVGIGTGTPAEALEIKTSSSPAIQLDQGGNYQGIIRLAGNDLEIRGSSGIMEFYNGAADGDSSTLALKIDASGHITKPLQPAFSVTANQQNNLPLNATTTLEFANEIFDQNADFNTGTYTFTAPVTGKYMLNVNLRMDSVDRDHIYLYMILKTSNREYEWLQDISVLYGDDPDYLPFTINVLADMDASDTAYVRMHIPNLGAAVSDVVGSSKSTFSGYLAC